MIYYYFFVLLLSGCVSSGILFPGSYTYQPSGPIESRWIKEADFSIYPDDVRKDFNKFKDKVVSWAGVIIEVRLEEPEDDPNYSYWIITADHHYFDRIDDRNIQPERYFLSKMGEGKFEVMVRMSRISGVDRDKFIRETKEWLSPGNMVVAYGRPTKGSSGIIRLLGHANAFPKKLYDVTKMSYGRDPKP